MSKKKLISLLLCIVLVFSFSACNTNDNGMKDGTYAGTGQGNNGEIEISVEVKDGKITNIEVIKHSETEGLSDKVFETIPQAIIDAQSTEVDVVSGATNASQGIIDAVNDALSYASSGDNSGELPKLSMTPGTYTGEAKGYHGTIQVEVTVTDTAISNVKVVDNIAFENPLIPPGDFWLLGFLRATTKDLEPIFETAKNVIPQRIIESQSLKVDTVSGATGSSNGIISAVKNAIELAGGNPKALQVEVAKKTESEEYTCDIVVVGGGTSGSVAAAKASDEGANVILIEKSGRVGGTGVLSYMPMTIGSNEHDEAGIEIDSQELYEDMMSQGHWYPNAKVLSKFLNESEDTIKWMDDHGFNWMLPPTEGVGDGSGNMSMVMYDAPPMSNEIQGFYNSMVENVDTIMYETTAKALIQNNKGEVVGVEAEKNDGTKIVINAKKVIMATGGFGGNIEMVKKYNNGSTIRTFGLAQNVGEGLNMMLDAGAVEGNIGGFVAHEQDVYMDIETDEDIDIIDKSIPYTLSITPTFMQVNQRGDRFTDENERADLLQSSANYYIGNGGVWYTLISQEQIDALKIQGLVGVGMNRPPIHYGFLLQPLPIDMPMTDIELVLQRAEEVGTAFKGENLDELAKAIGVKSDILKENVVRYNILCEEGEDKDFHKETTYMKQLPENGPYYAIKSVSLSYSTIGGVNVDENMQVLNSNEDPISGLYAVGVESLGTITDGVSYPDVEGLALGWGMTSGKIAGEQAAYSINK
ncbi:MAG: FAD-binding protein [Eubacteriaceae bacterium]